MTRRLRFRPEFKYDLRDAYQWYESREPGTGDRFLEAVAAALVVIRERALSRKKIYNDTRRVLVSRFPYAVFYRVADGSVLVIGCLDARRDPRTWEDRASR